jgi:hypothetical protein
MAELKTERIQKCYEIGEAEANSWEEVGAPN